MTWRCIEPEPPTPRRTVRCAKYPRYVAGAQACPPEDVGGLASYDQFLEALKDPNDPARQEMADWIGRKFDPEAFDLAKTNQILRQLFP